MQDIADVRAVIQLYIEGASGDAAKLIEAFHPDARMFGHIGEMATYIERRWWITNKTYAHNGGSPPEH